MSTPPPDTTASNGETLLLRLYVAGQSPKSIAAYSNLTCLCEQRLSTAYQIEVIDLVDNPELAREDQILAIPTLVRRHPEPVRRVIGDLSDIDRVLAGLDLPASAPAARLSTSPPANGTQSR